MSLPIRVTEMEIIKEFDAVDGFRPVLGLFEGVAPAQPTDTPE